MKRSDFKKARFVTSVARQEDFPITRTSQGEWIPEVAVVGRSNVGKSSLLNHLFCQKNLVKTSSKPGKTQTLNFFTLDGKLNFVDLPGYGYARAPLSVQKEWGIVIQSYLEGREALTHLLFLFDIRRTPKVEDVEFLCWIRSMDLSYTLILTKTDKLNRKKRHEQTERILSFFEEKTSGVIHYSVRKNQGRCELEKNLLELI